MPIHNEIFHSYRQQVKQIEDSIRLLVRHGYKVIDLENQLIYKDEETYKVKDLKYNRTPKQLANEGED